MLGITVILVRLIAAVNVINLVDNTAAPAVV